VAASVASTGPCYYDGSVLVVELKGGALTRVAPDGKKKVIAEVGGAPNGAAVGPDGKVYICNNGGLIFAEISGHTLPIPGLPPNYKGGSIQRVDLASGKVETVYTECDGHPLRGPNDLVFDSTGGMWFTDFGKVEERRRDRGGVYYAKPDGSLIKEMVYPIDGPNGIGLAPDDKRLYVPQTFEGRVWQWDIPSPGELRRVENPGGAFLSGPGGGTLLAGLPGYQLFDSMAVDSAGNVCVATLKRWMLETFFITPSPLWPIAVNNSHGIDSGSGAALATVLPVTWLPSDHRQVGPMK